MGAQSIREIVDYLRRLAPAFFAERMRGASDLDIRRLAEAARAPLCESHREFLLLMGATPATALNPFLNDRDYCVDTLLAAYSDMDLADERLPERIVPPPRVERRVIPLAKLPDALAVPLENLHDPKLREVFDAAIRTSLGKVVETPREP